jgi:hypothetical protein
MKLACRYCGQMFHDVEYGDGFLDGDRYHFIVAGPAGLLSGQKPSVAQKKKSVKRADVADPEDLEVTSMQDFLQVEPQSFDEIVPKTQEAIPDDVQQQ